MFHSATCPDISLLGVGGVVLGGIFDQCSSLSQEDCATSAGQALP